MTASTLTPIRLLIIASDPLARAGLAGLLADLPDCRVVGQVADDDLALAGLDSFRADVLLWDLGWDSDSASLDRWLDNEESPYPLLVLLADEATAPDIWRQGITNLLLRSASPEQIWAALQAVAQGLSVFDPALTEALTPLSSSALPPLMESLPEALTDRESEVLTLLAQGLTNKAIAHQLDISDHTVKFHVNAILTKLNAQSRTEAAVKASKFGLILL